MTDVVVEVGPCAIRGPHDAPPEWISAALESIDDDIALLDERPVAVQRLWEDVIGAVAGSDVDTLVLVCPTWWSLSRIDCVRTAALAVATTVAVHRRTESLRERIADRWITIVELAPELVVVAPPAMRAVVLPLRGIPADVAAVVGAVGASASVLMDVPTGVAGVAFFADAIAERLRARGIEVAFVAEGLVRQAKDPDQPVEVAERPRQMARVRCGAPLLVGVMSAVALSVGFAVRSPPDSGSDGMPMTLLVEGRIGVMVPADWTAQRITSGPGSARVQVVSPRDADVALHVTQSIGPPDQGLPETARTLRAALETEPEGVFVDFNPSDRQAGKTTVTYRELRADHHVAWAVQVDGTVRIAIGCQSAAGREHLVREACDQAVASAHAVF